MGFAKQKPEKLLGGKGHDTDAIRGDLEERGVKPVIHRMRSPRVQRRIAMRYAKTARAFLSIPMYRGSKSLDQKPLTA